MQICSILSTAIASAKIEEVWQRDEPFDCFFWREERGVGDLNNGNTKSHKKRKSEMKSSLLFIAFRWCLETILFQKIVVGVITQKVVGILGVNTFGSEWIVASLWEAT